jgi:hypothetical protein
MEEEEGCCEPKRTARAEDQGQTSSLQTRHRGPEMQPLDAANPFRCFFRYVTEIPMQRDFAQAG